MKINGQLCRMFAALVCALFCSYLTNAYSLSLMPDPVFSDRIVISIANIAFLIVLAGISVIRPSLFVFDSLVLALTLLGVGGMALWSFGVMQQSPFVVMAGTALTQLYWMLSLIAVGMSVMQLDRRRAALCIVCSFCLGALLRQLFVLWLPTSVGVVLYAVMPLLALLLVTPECRKSLRSFSSTEPYSWASVTNPQSFLPFGHQVFVCLLLFRIAPGFALNVGSGSGVSQSALLSLIPFALLLAAAIADHRLFRIDALFIEAALFVVAGFLLLPLSLPWAHQAMLTLLVVGAGIFEVFTWILLTSIARNSTAGSVATFAWGFAMIYSGTAVGQAVAALADSYADVQNMLVLIAAGIVFAFICYVFVALRSFSFSSVIASIVPLGNMPAENKTVRPASAMAAMASLCSAVPGFSTLTDREAEIMMLLAMGRNAPFICDELTISYNTVRTHVRHIYQKLDVHSQQELMTLVESSADGPSGAS